MRTAASSSVTISACCCSADRPGAEGQLILETLAIQTPRSCRLGCAESPVQFTVCAAVGSAAAAADTPPLSTSPPVNAAAESPADTPRNALRLGTIVIA